MRRLIIFGGWFLSIFSYSAHALETRGWKETKLSYADVEEQFTFKHCYQSLKQFDACINGLNAILATATPSWALFPGKRWDDSVLAGKKIKKYGPVTLALVHQPRGTRAQSFTTFRRERDKDLREWHNQYLRDDEVPFTDIVNDVRKWIVTEELEALQAAIAFNGYYAVARDPHTFLVPTKVADTLYGSNRYNEPEVQIEKRVIHSGTLKIGYIKISTFNDSLLRLSLKNTLEGQIAAGVGGFILDLRDNPGGSYERALEVLEFFSPKGSMMAGVRSHYEASDSEIVSRFADVGARYPFLQVVFGSLDVTHRYSLSDPLTQLPLVILVNAASASCAELVAGSLQEMSLFKGPRAFLVGERTFGKGTVQKLTPWKVDGVTMMRTVGYMERRSGSFQLIGITPDVPAYQKPDPTEDDKFAVREEDKYWSALPATGTRYRPQYPKVIKDLNDCVTRKGVAKKTWEVAIRKPDHAFLVAIDTLKCRIADFLE